MLTLLYQRITAAIQSFHVTIASFDRTLYVFFWVVASINIVHFLYILNTLRFLPEIMVLHKNIYFGIDLIGPWYYIGAFPLTGMVIGISNIIFARMFYSKSYMLSYFLTIAALTVGILLFIGSIVSIRENI